MAHLIIRGKRAEGEWGHIQKAVIMVIVILVLIAIIYFGYKSFKKDVSSCSLVTGTCVAAGTACPASSYVDADKSCPNSGICCRPEGFTMPGKEEKKEEPAPTQLTPEAILAQRFDDTEALVRAFNYQQARQAYLNIIIDHPGDTETQVKASFKMALVPFQISDNIRYTAAPEVGSIQETVSTLCENAQAIWAGQGNSIDDPDDTLPGSTIESYGTEMICIVGKIKYQIPDTVADMNVQKALDGQNFCRKDAMSIVTYCTGSFAGWAKMPTSDEWVPNYAKYLTKINSRSFSLPDVALYCYHANHLIEQHYETPSDGPTDEEKARIIGEIQEVKGILPSGWDLSDCQAALDLDTSRSPPAEPVG